MNSNGEMRSDSDLFQEPESIVPDGSSWVRPSFAELTPDIYCSLLQELQNKQLKFEMQAEELRSAHRAIESVRTARLDHYERASARKHAEALSACQTNVLEMIAQGLPATKSLTTLISKIEELCPRMLCTVLRIDDDGEYLRHFSSAGMPDEYNRMIDGTRIGPRSGSCGTAAFLRKQIIVEDIATDPLWQDFRDYALPFGLRACWSTPIFDDDGQVLGVFANYYSQPCRPAAEHIRLIAVATDIVSIALSKQQKEESLRLSELALNTVSQGVYITGPDERILWANPAFEKITGFQEWECRRRKCSFVQGLNTDEKSMQAIRAAINQGTEFVGEILNCREDKVTLWNELTISPIRDKKGQLTHFIGVVRDISLRKQALDALKESEARFRAIVEQAPLGIAEGEILGHRFISVNQRYADIVGYTVTELMEMSFVDFTHPDDIAIDLGEMKKLAAGEIPFFAIEKRFVRKDGRIVWVQLTVAGLGRDGAKPTRCMAVVDDITLRKETEKALVQSERRYRAIVEAEPECVKVVSENGELLEMNPAGLAMLEASSINEVQKHGMMELIVPKYRTAFSKLHEKAISGKRGLLQFEIVGLQGTPRWLETHAAPLPDSDGCVTKMLGITRDITERKQAEEVVRQLNAELENRVLERTAQLEAANKELESFSYSVSHDLRAPLRGVDGYARMLQEDCGGQLDTEGIRLIGVVRSEAQRMGRLIDDLLAFSRTGRKHFEVSPIDMRSLALAAYESIIPSMQEKSIDFKLNLLPSSHGDPALLLQVFVNLINNAVKFSRNQFAPIIEVGFEVGNGVTIYFVKDNGVGFDARYSQKLFGVFQRLHSEEEFEGTGIGLALVQRIIQRHGGKVWATSKPNSGATFYFTIPHSP